MSKSGQSGITYTESVMAEAFHTLLASHAGLPNVGSFKNVSREVACRQGRPDFITLRIQGNVIGYGLPEQVGYVGSAILALLKPKAGRTMDYILEHTCFQRESVKRSLNQLLSCGVVKCTDACSFCLGDVIYHMAVEIWAFELKLASPKRAVFQAQQSLMYANHAVIVAPPNQVASYELYKKAIERWGIWITSFDPIQGDFTVVRRGRRNSRISLQHKIYTLAQLAC